MKFATIMALAAVFAASPAQAQDVLTHWRALTLLDVEAAPRMLAEDHPGAAPEVGDSQFRTRLAAARQRAALLEPHEGYHSVLPGLAVPLSDKHVRSRPRFASENRPAPD